MRIIILPKYILPLGYGLTLYKLILVRKDGDIPYLVAHETKHSLDWQEIGFFKFPYLYIKECISKGYYNNKYEIAAREYGRLNRDKYMEYETISSHIGRKQLEGTSNWFEDKMCCLLGKFEHNHCNKSIGE